MSYIRFNIELSIKQPIPQALQDKLVEIKNAVKLLKTYATKINAGTDLEEETVRAKWHICHHDEGPNVPCEPLQEI